MKMLEIQPQPGPPSMEEMLGLPGPVTDDLYDVLGILLGIKGTWHRLWSCMVLNWAFQGSIEDADVFVSELRQEFEELLGRRMTEREWSALDAHAAGHAETVMKSGLRSLSRR